MSSIDKQKKLAKAKSKNAKLKNKAATNKANKKEKIVKNKKRPLIDRIKKAVRKNEMPAVFTRKDLNAWMEDNNIVKNSGKEYKKSSIKEMLSNSRKKDLYVRISPNGKKEYCFNKKFSK